MKYASLDLFSGKEGCISNYKIYYAYFGKLPNKITCSRINLGKLTQYVNQELKGQILNRHYVQHLGRGTRGVEVFDDAVWILKGEMLLSAGDIECSIYFTGEGEEEARKLMETLKTFQLKKRYSHSIGLVVPTMHGLDVTELKIKRPKLDLNLHYNESLQQVHPGILANLRKKDRGGLYLFHGLPGTGKTTYIRYLIHQVRKRVIFIPPRMAASLDTPEFTEFLVNCSNTVFVIEDAEELIVTRQGQRNSGLSMILNLSDGLLGEGLGIQIIATFNTDVMNIDEALLRKGRLSALYEFKALGIERANRLLSTLGRKNEVIRHPMTLAELYNAGSEDVSFKPLRQAIGFQSLQAS